MALKFEGAPDWLLQEYVNRKSPGQQASEGIQAGINTYAQMKKDQATLDLQKQTLASQDASRKATEFGAVAPYLQRDQIPNVAKGYGINIPPMPNAQAAPVGTPAEEVAQQSLSAEHAPFVLDHFNSLYGNQSAAPGGGPPQPPGRNDTSKFGREQYAKELSIQKTERDLATDKNAPENVLDKHGNKLFTVGKNDRIINPDDNKSETRAERLSNQLRTNLTSSLPYKNVNQLKAARDNIKNGLENPGAYGDLGMLFDYMKSLDPTSVVREGEQQSFRATGSFSNRMANTMNKLVSGETITPEQRNEVLRYANSRLKIAHDIYKTHSDPTLRQAKRMGIDPREIDPYFEDNLGFDTQQTTPVAGPYPDAGKEARYQAWKAANNK